MLAAPQRENSRPLAPLETTLRPEGLIFDLADVLYDGSMWHRWLLQLLQRLGLHTHYRAFFHLFERDYLVDVYRGEFAYWRALETFLKSVGMTNGQIDEVHAAGRCRFRQFNEAVRPFPGVLATLSRLNSAGVPLAILTNSPLSRPSVEELLERLQMGGRFHCVLTSRDLGAVLPSAATYEAALSALDLSPNQAAYVGHDSIELEGATAAGLTTIAVNYECQVQADIFCERFDELPSLVVESRRHVRAG